MERVKQVINEISDDRQVIIKDINGKITIIIGKIKTPKEKVTVDQQKKKRGRKPLEPEERKRRNTLRVRKWREERREKNINN